MQTKCNQNQRFSVEDIEQSLHQFVTIIEKELRMSFFVLHKQNGQTHKWKPCPEAHAKHLLYMSLKTYFGEKALVVEEIEAGAGKIDLYLGFGKNLHVLIELKMCGLGYSSTYA